jgi:hypothetical protein
LVPAAMAAALSAVSALPIPRPAAAARRPDRCACSQQRGRGPGIQPASPAGPRLIPNGGSDDAGAQQLGDVHHPDV